MTKKEFVVRQLAKTNKKNYENYVVTGIFHRLAEPQLKFVTPQHICSAVTTGPRSSS